MLYLKEIDYTIQVEDPNSFCEDLEASCLEHVTQTLKGRNYQGCHIVDILSITRHSMCHIVSSNLTAEGIVEVSMQALVQQISRGDILTDLTIFRTEPNVLFQNKERKISGGLKNKDLAKIIQNGQKIAIRVTDRMYEPLKTNIAVSGELLTCDRSFVVYKLSKGFTKAEVTQLNTMLGNYRRELTLREEIMSNPGDQRNAMLFFEILYYSFKTANKDRMETVGGWKGPKGNTPKGEVMDIQAFLRDPKGEQDYYWARPLEVLRSSPTIVRMKTVPKEYEDFVVEEPASVAFADFINSMDNMITAVRELSEVFANHKYLMEHKNVWRALQTQQM